MSMIPPETPPNSGDPDSTNTPEGDEPQTTENTEGFSETTDSPAAGAPEVFDDNDVTNPDSLAYAGEPEIRDREFVYATHMDPQRHAPGGQGIYLDDVQRQNAEIHRAKLEDRDPDLENPPAIAGTQLLPIHAARKLVPGDQTVNVQADVVLPVSVGVADDAIHTDANAQLARDLAENKQETESDKENAAV